MDKTHAMIASDSADQDGGVPPLRRRIMQSNRRRDTGPEKAVRSALHALGLRFRVDFAIRPTEGRSVRPDLVFSRRRVAVFVDGCYWHGCPIHATWPKTNAGFWKDKIETNRRRDADTRRRLEADGWVVIRIWEHEDPAAAAATIEQVVRRAGCEG